jgi:hypothetical protein
MSVRLLEMGANTKILFFFGICIVVFLILKSDYSYKLHSTLWKHYDGFDNSSVPDLKNTDNDTNQNTSYVLHKQYMESGQRQFNKLTNIFNSANPALQFSENTEKSFQNAFGTANVSGNENAFQLSGTDPLKNPYKMPSAISESIQRAKICEKIRATDCNAFNDAEFAKYCGIGFDTNGIASDGSTHIGGFYVSNEDRAKQIDQYHEIERTQPGIDPFSAFKPTLGTVRSGMFAVDASSCSILKEKVECQQKKTFGVPNCAQCYTTGEFNRIDPSTKNVLSDIQLVAVGKGELFINNNNDNTTNNKVMQLDPNTPVNISLQSLGIVEGNEFVINVSGPGMYIAGYISGVTAKGEFKMDINNLISTDLVSGYKPTLGGSAFINGMKCLIITGSKGTINVKLRATLPFSFVPINYHESAYCMNGPYITTQAGAEFLQSDPCFGNGNSPGKYKSECLQEKFIQLGCTNNGSGFPSTVEKASALMYDKQSGKARTIDEIADYIYSQSLMATNGVDRNGQRISLQQWNDASLFCTGTSITNPCDSVMNGGQMNDECMSYLYLNKGANGRIGATYTMPTTNASQAGSLENSTIPNTYCQPGATMDPMTITGKESAKQFISSEKTGNNIIQTVKNFYDSLHRSANDNSISIEKRKNAIQNCYGANVSAM